MLNIRTILLSAVVLIVLGLAARLVTARTEVVSNASSDSASVIDNQEPSANQNIAPISSYRSPLDECYDVPLREAAACRTESQPLVPSHRSSYRYELDECSDVSLIELASCRKASQVPIPPYRSPLDECFDVPLREVTSCRNTSQASVP